MICRLVFASCIVLACVPSVWAGTYSTIFSATENPISEGGRWINGGTVGLDWANVRTTPGKAFGTQNGAGGYDDSTAILNGAWNANHTAQATVFVASVPPSNAFAEIELRLRSTLTAHTNAGYEVLCNLIPGKGYGLNVIRWFGPLNSWKEIAQAGGGFDHCSHGDVLKATITGNPPTITVWVNGVQRVQVTDGLANPPITGNPGMGFWNGQATNTDYGFSYFSATDEDNGGSPQPPSAPNGLVVQ